MRLSELKLPSYLTKAQKKKIIKSEIELRRGHKKMIDEEIRHLNRLYNSFK